MNGKLIQCSKHRARDGETVKNKPHSFWKQHQFRLCWVQDKNREWPVMLGTRSRLEWDRMKDEDSDQEGKRTRERNLREETEAQKEWNTANLKVPLCCRLQLNRYGKERSHVRCHWTGSSDQAAKDPLGHGSPCQQSTLPQEATEELFAGCSIYFKSEPMLSPLQGVDKNIPHPNNPQVSFIIPSEPVLVWQ